MDKEKLEHYLSLEKGELTVREAIENYTKEKRKRYYLRRNNDGSYYLFSKKPVMGSSFWISGGTTAKFIIPFPEDTKPKNSYNLTDSQFRVFVQFFERYPEETVKRIMGTPLFAKFINTLELWEKKPKI